MRIVALLRGLQGLLLTFSAIASAFASSPINSLEHQVRAQFPSVTHDSKATFGAAQELVAGRMMSGLRAQENSRALRVFYPRSYDEPFVAEIGEQRVVLRALGARFAPAVTSAGKVFYTTPHDSVDVIEVPATGRSEELLVLHNERAPRVFEYEIVEMRGAAGVIVRDGALLFVPDRLTATVNPIATDRFIAPPLSLQIDRPWVIDAHGKRSESAAQWTVVSEEGQPRTIRLTINSDLLSYPLVVDPTFSVTGSMAAARFGHTATLLPNGKVLIAGGYNGDYLDAAELYDPGTGTFSATGSMTAPRGFHSATPLPNGKVLIAGGENGDPRSPSQLNTAELYDPVTGMFTATGNMTTARENHTATLLSNGKVLIAGGFDGNSPINLADLYNPSAGTFTPTGTMQVPRMAHTATLLASGKVLIAGGFDGASYLKSSELYDAGAFTASGDMASAHAYHTATLLPNGKVLIAGGFNGAYTNICALFDGVGTFSATGNMTTSRGSHSATLLPSGKVLISGGYTGSDYTNTAELYDAGTFTGTASMSTPRSTFTATLLPSGAVLMAGGGNGVATLNTAEFYYPGGGTFSGTGTMTAAHGDSGTATLLPNGKVLIAGGAGSPGTSELYDPSTSTFTAAGSGPNRYGHTATLLLSGKVLMTGGYENGGYSSNVEELYDPATATFTILHLPDAVDQNSATLLPNGKVLVAGGFTLTPAAALLYDPVTGAFSATGNAATWLRKHTATLLPNGKVLIVGGQYNPDTAELYDPTAGAFTLTGNMTVPRSSGHAATLLPNGKVLITGGINTSGYLNAAELYDPTTGTFTATGNMTVARTGHTATLLPGGKVLIAGGSNGTDLNTAELFDPATGAFSLTGNMSGPRKLHTATLLPNGTVLITSGSNGSTSLNTAELYNEGLGFADARRPVVSALASLLCQPVNLALTGSLFTGDSDGSSGATNTSPANFPFVRLQRVDNDRLLFATLQSFSSVNASAALAGLASGHYRVAVVSNAIPSKEQITEVATTPLLGAYATTSVNVSNSTTVNPSSLPSGYNGTLYPLEVNASAGFTGTLSINASTGVVSAANAGPVGDYTITVSSPTDCGSPATTFTLKVIGPPASMSTTGTPQSAVVNTAFASPLQVTVKDSAGHLLNNVTVTFSVPSSGASATLSAGSVQTDSSGVASVNATANGIWGSYNVTATAGSVTANFALTNAVGVPTNVVATATAPTSVLITWDGVAGATYEVLRLAAGGATSTLGTSASGSFPDNTAAANTSYLYEVRATVPNTTAYSTPDLATTVIFTDASVVGTIIKAVHVDELRTAVNAVRTLAGKSAASFTDPTLTSGSTIIKAVHLTELRSALDQARSSLLLPAISYTNPTIAAGTSIVFAADINDLRNGVK